MTSLKLEIFDHTTLSAFYIFKVLETHAGLGKTMHYVCLYGILSLDARATTRNGVNFNTGALHEMRLKGLNS